MNAHSISGEHILLALIHDQRAMDSEFLRHLKEKYLDFDISIQNLSEASSPTSGKDFEDEEDEDEEFSPFKSDSRQKQDAQQSQKRKPQGNKTGTDTPTLISLAMT